MSDLANTFNIITPQQQNVVQLPTPPKQVQTKKIDQIIDGAMLEDFQQTRHNFNLILEMGRTALEQSCALAESATDPKWYRVVSELITSVTETNKELLNIYEKLSIVKKNLAGVENIKKEEIQGGVVIDKAVFIGSAKDLLDQIKTTSQQIDHDPISR